MRVDHRHASLLARTIRENPGAVADALAHHRANCSILTGTEAVSGEPMLRAENWGAFRDERGNFVSWATDVWHRLAAWDRVLSDIEFDDRVSSAAFTALEHWKGSELVIGSCHLPAHIADDLRDGRKTPRTRAYRESLGSLRDMVARQRRKHPDRYIVLAGDWNLDMRTEFARDLFARTFKGTGLRMVPVPAGNEGSFNGRLIDWAFTNLHSSGDVLKLTDASDHKAVAFVHEEK